MVFEKKKDKERKENPVYGKKGLWSIKKSWIDDEKEIMCNYIYKF